MSPRKRRRSQALPETEGDRGTPNQHLVSDRLPTNDLDKERVVWDSFREEHFEAVDQMPLSLHRHYALMQELDQQAHSYIVQLLPTVQRYTSRRREMVDRLYKPCLIAVTGSSGSGVSPDVDVPLKEERSSSPPPLTIRDHTSSSLLESISASHSASRTFRVAPSTRRNLSHSESQQTTQQMLSQIAWLSDEIFRASEEKVNLVQAAFDSADRHVRILDQAIKEQEASIGSGVRPSHLAPNNLPELVVPRWARPSRTPLSPMDKDDDDITFPVREASQPHTLYKSRKRGHLSGSGTQREGSSLTIMLPASSNGLIDSPEQLFCYCKRVSFGEMVACDNEKCKIEWFHLECLRLGETPEGSWYCSDNCRASARRKRH